jgi:hypothetical protein
VNKSKFGKRSFRAVCCTNLCVNPLHSSAKRLTKLFKWYAPFETDITCSGAASVQKVKYLGNVSHCVCKTELCSLPEIDI